MSLHESGEMYLETIYILTAQKNAVRSLDIAEYMGYSKPSVSRALHLLRKAGYVSVTSDGLVHLTDEGARIAANIYERHTVFTQLLVHLGVDEPTAAADACKMEHDITDISFEAIKRYLAASRAP